jgi:hypothetical protein
MAMSFSAIDVASGLFWLTTKAMDFRGCISENRGAKSRFWQRQWVFFGDFFHKARFHLRLGECFC